MKLALLHTISPCSQDIEDVGGHKCTVETQTGITDKQLHIFWVTDELVDDQLNTSWSSDVGETSTRRDIPGWKSTKSAFVDFPVKTKFHFPLQCLECLFPLSRTVIFGSMFRMGG